MENKIQLFSFEGVDTLDSRDVANIIGKKHKELLRDIRRYIKDIDDSAKLRSPQFFIPSTYESKQGKILPNFLITRMGCEFVANKLTGKKGSLFTAKYVSIFNQQKASLNEIYNKFQIPRNYADALRLAANQQEQLEKQKPKVDYYDSQMRNPGLMTITEIAKDFGMSGQAMNAKLEELHIQYKRGGKWFLYQKYADKGYTQYEPYSYDKNGHKGLHNNLKWTQRGRKFIYDKLAEVEIHPTLEQMDLLEG